MLKKLISIVLLLTFSLSTISPAFASEITRISDEVLRVSGQLASQDTDELLQSKPDILENGKEVYSNDQTQDLNKTAVNSSLKDYKTEEELKQAIIGDQKWVENYPNGLFNFIGTQFQINENQEYFEMAVVRQGGTKGKATVNFKAIDISAQYGKDYIIRVYENSKTNEMVKNEDAIPLIETVGDNATINISEPVAGPDGEKLPVEVTEAVTGQAIQIAAEAVTGQAITVGTANSNISLYTDLAESVVTVGEGSENAVSSLREARETYLGEKSDRPNWKTIDQGKVEELKSAYDKFLYNVPGVETTLEFEDGEYIKYLYLVPLNDQISESEEQVMFALERPSNDASRGEFYMAYLNIVDDEVPETSKFEIETPSVVAKDGLTSIVVRREGGLQQYASVTIGTEEGSALSGIDYEPGLKELFFTPGTSEQAISVNVLDNPERKTDRQFTIALDRTSNNVNQDSAEAVVTIPALYNIKMLSASNTGENSAIKLAPGLSSATENINAEKISAYGFSPAKGQWMITGEDFVKDATITKMRDDAVLHQNGNGLSADYMCSEKYDPASSMSYPVNGLGGVDSIAFDYYNKWSYGPFVFSVELGGIFSYDYQWYTQIEGIAYPHALHRVLSIHDAMETQINAIRLVSYTYNNNTVRASPYTSGLTLALQEYNLKCLPQKMTRTKFKLEKQMFSPIGKIEYDPGSLYVETVNSNVGNYQESPVEPKVFRSDRVKFNYKYSDENLNGRYAKYGGFKVKVGDGWYYYRGTELILDESFFNIAGMAKAIQAGTIEVQPIFDMRSADFYVQVNTNEVSLVNIGNASSFSKKIGTFLCVGDVITGLEAKFVRNTPELPVWNSYLEYWDEQNHQPDNSNIVVTEPKLNKIIDYTLVGGYNSLHLDMGETLIVQANPNVYKDGITILSYLLDGDSFVTSDIETLYKNNDKNHQLDIEFNYVYDPNFPRASNFGTPQKAHLNVYKNNGTIRKSYVIDYDDNSKSFKFSGNLTEWEFDDFASIIVEGSAMNGNRLAQTQEVVIDFLLNSRDGILVMSPGGKDAKVGEIQTPVVIDSANPMGTYKMTAVTSPGFTTAWKDNSPDANNNGQTTDPGEITALQKELAERLNDKGYLDSDSLKWKTAYVDEVFWGNYFNFTPSYFNVSKIHYSFEKLPAGTVDWTVVVEPKERYHTVLNPEVLSTPIPITNGEVYIGDKKILDSDLDGNGVGDGRYTDIGSQYLNGNRYQGQVLYKGQTFYFGVKGGSTVPVTIYTSDLMRPYEFKAEIGGKNQELTSVNTALNIVDKTTIFSYRIESTVGIVPNDSIIRIYDSKGKLHSEARTGNCNEKSREFSYAMNTYQSGVKPGYKMTIAGLYVGIDEVDNKEKILHEYPEVPVGMTFVKPLTAITAISSFKTPLQPVVKAMGKITNQYDLGMDVQVDKVIPTVIPATEDSPQRKVKIISFGFNGEYMKKFEKAAKDTSKGNDEVLKEDMDSKNTEEDLGKSVDKATEDPEKAPKSKKSGGGDFNMTYTISLALSLEMGQECENGIYADTGITYFSSLVIMATLQADYKKSHTYMTPVGVPITVTLDAGGSSTAVVAFDADHTKPYDDKYKMDGEGTIELKPSNYDIYSKFIIKPSVELSARAGYDSLHLELSGRAEFEFTFRRDMPITGDVINSGSGGMTLSAKLKAKMLFVQKKWTLYDSKYISFFGDHNNAQSALMSALNNPYQNYLYEKIDTIDDGDIIPRNYISDRGNLNNVNSNEGGLLKSVNAGNEIVLQEGVFPYPETKLIPIDDNKTLLLFIDDDISRDERNRASLWYSILENGSSTPPVALDNNGTWDETPDAFVVDNRILVTWSDADRNFTTTDTQRSILKAMNISGKWFDIVTKTFGEKFAITKTIVGGDHSGDVNPMISYDTKTHRLMVYYNKIDYDDRWETTQNLSDPNEVVHDETPEPLYGDLINGYNVIAYRYADYDSVQEEFVWNNTYTVEEGLDAAKYYGQRFLDLAPIGTIREEEHQIVDETISVGEGENDAPVTLTHIGTTQIVEAYSGLKDPRIVESDLITHDGLAVFAYIMDANSDLNTYEDQQLYVQTYNYATKTFSSPIEITSNSVQDTHPRFVQFGDDTYLYWLQDGDIVYTCISDLLTVDGKLKAIVEPVSGKTFHILDKTNTTKEGHVNTAVNHTNHIDEFKLASKDDTIYVLWEEACISYKNGLKPGDPGTEDPANLHKERQIFAACKVSTETINYPWSKPVQVTSDVGANYSDLSFVVPEDEQFMVAYARYTQNYDDNAGYFTNANSIRALAVNQFTITDEFELGDITTDTEHPMPRKTVAATVVLSNTGLKALSNPYYQLYMNIDGIKYYESEWLSGNVDDNVKGYILGGDSITLHGNFTMPESLDSIKEIKVGFRVKNQEGDQMAEKESLISIKPDLQIHVMGSELTNKDQAYVILYVENSGNKSFNDTFTISAGDKVLHTEQVELGVGEGKNIPLEIELDGAKFGDLLTADDGSRFDVLNLDFKLGEFKATGYLTRQISKQDIDELQKVKSFDVNNNGRLLPNGGTVNIGMNNTVSLETQIVKSDEEALLTKAEAKTSETLEVNWISSNPNIVSVLANGTLVPLATGSATVTASLQPICERVVSYSSGFRTINTSYELPTGVTKDISFTVNVSNVSSGASDYVDKKPDEKSDIGSVQCTEKVEGDKLTLTIDEIILAEAVKNITDTLTLESSSGTDQIKQVTTTLTPNNLKSLEQSKVKRLIINSVMGSISLNRTAIDNLANIASGKPVVIEFAKHDGIIEVLIKVEDREIHNLNGGIILVSTFYTANKGENPNCILVYYVNDQAAPKLIKASLYKAESGEILFRTDKLGRFSIAYNNVKFTDDLGWAEEYINFLSSRNIISGVAKGIFAKDKTVTRAEFVTMLALLTDDVQLTDTATKFTDIDSSTWYAKYVKWAYKNGIITGTSTTTFSPNKPISREQMAVMLKNYMTYAQMPLEEENKAEFKDKNAISSWALVAVNDMKAMNIMNGTGDNKIEPKRLSSRAEAVRVIAEILKLYLK